MDRSKPQKSAHVFPTENHTSNQRNKTNDVEAVEIGELTKDVVDSFAPECEQRKISLDTDLTPLTAAVDRQEIHRAVAQMLENAIASMPDGGQISVTLIDSQQHWELEVADSVGQIYTNNWKDRIDANDVCHQSNLMRISPLNKRLDPVRNVATRHGGQIQSWVCPQGGTANVLIIPRSNQRQPLQN